MSLHLASLWNRCFRQVGNGVLPLPALLHDTWLFWSPTDVSQAVEHRKATWDRVAELYGQGIKQIHNWHIAHKSYVKVLDYIKQAIPLSRKSFFFFIFDDYCRVKRRGRFSLPSCRFLTRCRVRKEVKKKLVNYFFSVFISAIDGNYTEWTKWSDCSATCGNGSKTRIRSCTNPPPQYGGDNCVDLGPDTDITECNLKPCSKYILQVHFIVKRLYKFQLSLVK